MTGHSSLEKFMDDTAPYTCIGRKLLLHGSLRLQKCFQNENKIYVRPSL